LKRGYFVTVVDGGFCLNARVIYKHETLLVVTLKWSEIMGTYNTLDIVVKDRRTK